MKILLVRSAIADQNRKIASNQEEASKVAMNAKPIAAYGGKGQLQSTWRSQKLPGNRAFRTHFTGTLLVLELCLIDTLCANQATPGGLSDLRDGFYT